MIPGTDMYEFDPELVKMKANWLAKKHRLQYFRVLKVLEDTVLRESIHPFEYEPDEVETADLVDYLLFEPDLQEALTFLRPKVALLLFESRDYKKVDNWMKEACNFLQRFKTHILY